MEPEPESTEKPAWFTNPAMDDPALHENLHLLSREQNIQNSALLSMTRCDGVDVGGGAPNGPARVDHRLATGRKLQVCKRRSG